MEITVRNRERFHHDFHIAKEEYWGQWDIHHTRTQH